MLSQTDQTAGILTAGATSSHPGSLAGLMDSQNSDNRTLSVKKQGVSFIQRKQGLVANKKEEREQNSMSLDKYKDVDLVKRPEVDQLRALMNAQNDELRTRLNEIARGLREDTEAKIVRTREAVLRVSQTLKGLLDWKFEHKDDYERVKKKVEVMFKEKNRLEQELVDAILEPDDHEKSSPR